MSSKPPPTPRKFGNIAALTFQVGAGAGAEVQLLPAGEFSPIDGRPTPWGTWKLTDSNASSVVALANQRINEFVIDYEHQTQLADTNGQPAPAAGWFKKLEFRPNKGLWATDVRGTARARLWASGSPPSSPSRPPRRSPRSRSRWEAKA